MRRTVAAAVLAAALCSAGCAGTPESKPPPEPAPDSAPAPASPGTHGGLAECLHANGVPDSTGPAAVLGPPADVDPGVWDRAMTACSTLAPGPSAP
jgi:hypothetical protein